MAAQNVANMAKLMECHTKNVAALTAKLEKISVLAKEEPKIPLLKT